MDWTQDKLCYAFFGSLASVFIGAMLLYLRSSQLEPEQPVSDGTLQNKRKIRKKEKEREKRSTKKTNVATTATEEETPEEGDSQNDPFGLGIDPFYASKSSKKPKASVDKTNAQLPSTEKPVVSEQIIEEVVFDSPVGVVKPSPILPQEDTVDAPIVTVFEDHLPPKDISTDSGIPSDVPEPVIVKVAPPSQKPKKNANKSKNRAPTKTETPVVATMPVEPEVVSPVPIAAEIETVEENNVSEENVVAEDAKAEAKAIKKKLKKKNRLHSENGQALLDNVLQLIDQGYYSPDAVQCLITALTDFGQSGAQEAWITMNDPEEKYHKRLNQLEALAQQNEKQLKNQDDIIGTLNSDIRKKEQQFEKRISSVRRELDGAISFRKTAEMEIKVLSEKLKKNELKCAEVDYAKQENDKYMEDLSLALKKAHNELAQKDSELEELNVHFRQIELTHQNDFESRFRELELKTKHDIAAITTNFESEKNILLQEKDKEVQHLSMQLAAAKNTVIEQNERLETDNASLKNAILEVESLKRECLSLASSNSKFESKLSEVNQVDSNLHKELKELQSSNETLKKEYEKILAEKDGLNAKLKESTLATRTTCDESDKLIKDLKQQLESVNKSLSAQENSCNSLKQLSDKLSKDLSEVSASKVQLTANLDKANTEIETIRKQKDDAVSRLETSQKNHKSELLTLQNKCSDLQKQLTRKPSPTPSSKPDGDILRQKEELEKRNSLLSKKYEESLRDNFDLHAQIKVLSSNPPSPVPSPVPAVDEQQQIKLTQNIQSMSDRVLSVSSQLNEMKAAISRLVLERSTSPGVPAYMSGDNLSPAKGESSSNSIDVVTISASEQTTDERSRKELENLCNENCELKNTISKLNKMIQMHTHSSNLVDVPEDKAEVSNTKKSKKRKNGPTKMNGNDQKILDINGN